MSPAHREHKKYKKITDLHLAIDHPSILSLSIDMMNLCQIVFLPECGVEDMVQVNRQDVQEPRGSSSLV